MNTPDLTRVTSHKKPRYQHLKVGFRPADSTWLVGFSRDQYINHPEAEHAYWTEKWERLFGPIDFGVRRGEHETPLDEMTEAQRAAWEVLSGYPDLNGLSEGNYYGRTQVETCGDSLSESSIKNLRKNKFKLTRWAKDTKNGESYDQLAHAQAPLDLVIENEEPVWFIKEVVDQNLANFDAQFEYNLECAAKERDLLKVWDPNEDFNYGMAQSGLRMALSDIAMDERNLVSPDYNAEYEYPGLEATKARYERMLAQALKVFPDFSVPEEKYF